MKHDVLEDAAPKVDRSEDEARRDFLVKWSRLALAAVPAITIIANPVPGMSASTCDNGSGNDSEGCSPSDEGNDDESGTTSSSFDGGDSFDGDFSG